MPEATSKAFVCQRCTTCCRWPGEVRLEEAEVTHIAIFMSLPESAFIQHFTRLNRFRHGLALEEKADGACIFLEGNDCAIQPVKPRQCREFPNGWNFPGFKETCRARLAAES